MLILHLSTSISVGDSDEAIIDGKTAMVTWRDPDVAVIEPNDARRILAILPNKLLLNFVCDDEGSEYSIRAHAALISDAAVEIPVAATASAWPRETINVDFPDLAHGAPPEARLPAPTYFIFAAYNP
jgi:hypothetical protein